MPKLPPGPSFILHRLFSWEAVGYSGFVYFLRVGTRKIGTNVSLGIILSSFVVTLLTLFRFLTLPLLFIKYIHTLHIGCSCRCVKQNTRGLKLNIRHESSNERFWPFEEFPRLQLQVRSPALKSRFRLVNGCSWLIFQEVRSTSTTSPHRRNK